MKKYLYNIKDVDKDIYNQAKEHLDNLAKPLGSLGELEEISSRLCSIYHTKEIKMPKKCIIVLASDNGIFEEGVASTPQEVTAIQSINILKNKTGVGVLAKHFGINLMVCDLGIIITIFYYIAMYDILRQEKNIVNLIYIPIFSRSLVGLYIMKTKPSLNSGFIASFKKDLEPKHFYLGLSLLVLFIILSTFYIGIDLFLVMLISSFILYIYCKKSFNGISGDLCGFIITLTSLIGVIYTSF